MKKLSRFCAVAVLTLALALTAFAGDIGFPGIVNLPPPPQSSVTDDTGTPSVASTGDMSPPGLTTLDPVTEAALDLLQSILSLF